MDARVLLFPSFFFFSLTLGSVAPSGFRIDASCHGNEAWNWVHPIAPPKGFPVGQLVPLQMDESQFPQESSLLVGGDDIPAAGRGPGARSQCPVSLHVHQEGNCAGLASWIHPIKELLDPFPDGSVAPAPWFQPVCLRAGRAVGCR